MKTSIKTEDQWKKLNQLARDNPALAARINADPWIIGILAAMSALLRVVPNVPGSMVTDLTSAVPMPHALYFGTPCPFRGVTVSSADHAQLILARYLDVISPLRDLIAAHSGIPGWLANAAFWLEDLDARITVDTLFGVESHNVLCLTWAGFSSSLRDRAWTLARLSAATRSVSRFRE